MKKQNIEKAKKFAKQLAEQESKEFYKLAYEYHLKQAIVLMRMNEVGE